jgi:hypothetical protein
VIAGSRTLAQWQWQWQGYAGAVSLALSAEGERLADSLVVSGHPSTPAYTDPAYPVSGRFVPS